MSSALRFYVSILKGTKSYTTSRKFPFVAPSSEWLLFQYKRTLLVMEP